MQDLLKVLDTLTNDELEAIIDRAEAILQRIFPAHFGERRIISEGYWNSCPIM